MEKLCEFRGKEYLFDFQDLSHWMYKSWVFEDLKTFKNNSERMIETPIQKSAKFIHIYEFQLSFRNIQFHKRLVYMKTDHIWYFYLFHLFNIYVYIYI